MKIILFNLILLMFICFEGKAQNCQSPCPYYNDFVRMAQANTVKNTQTKLNYYRAAIVAAKDCNCPDLERNANEQIDTLFVIIEEEKRTAELQAQTILEQQDKIEVALEDTKKAKINNEKIISALDFYDGKFALASKGEKYGFINKVGDTEIEFIYDKGEPFNQETGFAEMERGDVKYLLDAENKEYKLVRISEILKNIDNTDLIVYDEEIKWLESVANEELNMTTLLEMELLVHENNIKRDSIALEKERDEKVQTYWIDELKADKELLGITRNKLQNNKKNKDTEIGSRLNELRVKLEVIEENQKVANDQLFKVLKDGNEPLALDFSREYNLDIISILEQIANDEFISSKVELLFLNKTDLDRIPSFISKFKNLKKLHLNDTKIHVLPSSLKELTQLVRLDLSNTKVSTLPKDFGNLVALKYLDLSGTPLNKLPSSFFNLKSLEVLNLKETKIKEFSKSILQLSNLTRLSLPSGISEVPVNISNLKKLKYLDLNDSFMKNLPESIGQLYNLKILHFPKGLEKLPNSIFNLKELDVLNLIMTNIEILPESIGQLTKLRGLICPQFLEKMPASISNLKQLEILFLTSRYVRLEPESIGQFTNLRHLTLPASLTEFPDSLSKLTKLEVLDLNYTRIKSIPECIGQLQNLRELSLPISLEELSLNVFKLKKLEVFDYKRRGLKKLPKEIGQLLNLRKLNLPLTLEELPKSLTQLKKLEELSLRNTRIKALPEGFGNLTDLRVLDLFQSEIDALLEEVCNLTQLTNLNLQHTNISNLPQNIGNLINLKVLILRYTNIEKVPASINQLVNLEELALPKILNINNFPDLSNLKSLRKLSFILYQKENYSSFKAKLKTLKGKLPNCEFDITDEKGDQIKLSAEK